MRPTVQAARNRENHPVCEMCFIGCDPRTYEYRKARLCPVCFDYRAPLIIQPGHMIKENKVCLPLLPPTT